MIFHFLRELKLRSESLFYFSIILVIISILYYVLTKITTSKIDGINVWFKPFKFSISIAIYCGTMAWYVYELPNVNKTVFSWTNIILFSFEIIYISIQAARKERSHFNTTTPLYTILYGAMAAAAIIISLYAAYIGVEFFRSDLPHLSDYYKSAITLSIFIFVTFSLEGLLMGGRLSHTVGNNVQNTFLPILKWNMKEGDLRVAHFIGMHSLQVIPLVSFYLLKNTKGVFVLCCLYMLFAVFVLVQALQSKPFIKSKSITKQNGVVD